MTVRKSVIRPAGPRHIRGERIKDEVYRQMFRLEECRPGAEMRLALALLRAWLSAYSKPDGGEEREWLKNVSQICVQMIETAMQTGNTPPPDGQ
jgi:hypothetical protein